MTGNFNDVKEVPTNKFAESSLGKKAESRDKIERIFVIMVFQLTIK